MKNPRNRLVKTRCRLLWVKEWKYSSKTTPGFHIQNYPLAGNLSFPRLEIFPINPGQINIHTHTYKVSQKNRIFESFMGTP